MKRDAWIDLPRHRYEKVWDRFEEAFEFKPSTRSRKWQTFREPVPSATWDISDLLAEFCPWRDAQATPHNLALLKALKAHVPEDERVLALDWQHSSYEFFPHRFRGLDEPHNWCIPSLPSGEYHIFVTEDHRLGSLGHPWAQTLCVFGVGFVETFKKVSPLAQNRLLRNQAEAVEGRRPQRASRKRSRGG